MTEPRGDEGEGATPPASSALSANPAANPAGSRASDPTTSPAADPTANTVADPAANPTADPGGRGGSRLRDRVRDFLRDSPRAPFVVLAVAFAAVFWFSHSRGGFFRLPDSDAPSFHTLARAANLTPDLGFVGFERLTLDAEGEVVHDLSNRFPFGGGSLIGLVVAPFAEDLAAQMYAARVLMMLFFFGAVLFAYRALEELLGDRFAALGATLLAFSSFYWQYADLVLSEGAPTVFGFLLVFHGMVVFLRERRLRPLLLRAAAGLLLGWQVYGLIVPFVLFGLFAEGRRAFRESAAGAAGLRPVLRAAAGAGRRSPFTRLFAFSVLFGALLLTLNLGGEYLVLEGKTKVTELPSVRSNRFGFEEDFDRRYADRVGWAPFLTGQGHRIGRLVLPQAVPGFAGALGSHPEEPLEWEGVVFGALAAVSAIGLAAFSPARTAFLTLAVSGFVWALPLRHPTAFQDFESLYYLGIPLTLYSLLLLRLRRRAGDRWVQRAAGAALFVFLWSHHHLAEAGYDEFRERRQDAEVSDFEVIRRITAGKTVFVPRDPFHRAEFGGMRAPYFYLTGSVVVHRREHRARADFRLSDELLPGARLLTPENIEVFLYDQRDLEGLAERAGPPRLESFFEVHLGEEWLVYVREPCEPADLEPRFFLHVRPRRPEDLPEARRSSRFDNLDFDFADRVLEAGERCVAAVWLPDYEIRSVTTGQFVRGADGSFENLWHGEFTVGGGGPDSPQ